MHSPIHNPYKAHTPTNRNSNIYQCLLGYWISTLFPPFIPQGLQIPLRYYKCVQSFYLFSQAVKVNLLYFSTATRKEVKNGSQIFHGLWKALAYKTIKPAVHKTCDSLQLLEWIDFQSQHAFSISAMHIWTDWISPCVVWTFKARQSSLLTSRRVCLSVISKCISSFSICSVLIRLVVTEDFTVK